MDYERSEDIAHIYLNRPHRLNAVVPQLVEDLCRALDLAMEEQVGAVIFSGRGRAFCSGADLRHEEPPVTEAEERHRLQRLQDVTRKIRQSPHAVIAAVHGYALGAGCEFALCSDFVVAAETARFGFPEVSVGLGVTGGISHVLPATIGLALAKELVLLGEHFDAARAAQLGLINRVVPDDELERAALQMARLLRDLPRAALALAKSALDQGAQSTIESAYETETNNALDLRHADDARRAAEAFRRRSKTRKGER